MFNRVALVWAIVWRELEPARRTVVSVGEWAVTENCVPRGKSLN